MISDWDLLLRILIPFGTLALGVFLRDRFERRPSVVYYLGTVSDFLIRNDGRRTSSTGEQDDPETESSQPFAKDIGVYTHSVVISNKGRASANNVRLGHVVLPEHYFVFPKVEYKMSDVKDSGCDIVFPILRPTETVTVSYLYFQPVRAEQIHTYVKSDEGLARGISVFQTRLYPKWVNISLGIAIISGVVSWVYLIVILVRKLL